MGTHQAVAYEVVLTNLSITDEDANVCSKRAKITIGQEHSNICTDANGRHLHGLGQDQLPISELVQPHTDSARERSRDNAIASDGKTKVEIDLNREAQHHSSIDARRVLVHGSRLPVNG